MSAPLCDADPRRAGCQDHLQHLEDTNSFLVPLDRRREWFRYHGLFREFLLGELRRVEPEAVMKLHLRAADWYEANGSPALAARAPARHDRTRPLCSAGHAIGRCRPTTRARCRSCSGGSRRWATLPSRPIRRWPSWPAGLRVLTGQTADAERWAAIADRRIVRPAAGRRDRVVRLRQSHAPSRHVCRRSRADDG